MLFDALAGNQALKRQLSAQEKGRGLSHAYLISGPRGSGKSTLARLMAAAMVCTGQGEKPCGVCPGCKKALGDIHPDVIHVDLPEGKREIVIEQARRMRADAFIRPNEAPRKVYVVHHADAMNGYAQNSILKLLEEGPAYAAFLLLTDNPAGMLTTIRSRCEGLSLSPVSREEAEGFLRARFPDKSDAQIRAAAVRCGGILGTAVQELEGALSPQGAQAARELVQVFASGSELDLAVFCVGLEKWDRSALSDVLRRSTELLRHALALQTGAQAGPPDEGDLEAVRAAAGLPAGALLGAAEELQKLDRALDFNVGAGHLCGALCAKLTEGKI